MGHQTIDFLGHGWGFPVRPILEPDVTVSPGIEIGPEREEEKIRQAIWIILATAPGERAMRPDFGCGIHNLVFAVNDRTTIGRAVDSVRESLIVWETRIDVLDVTAEVRDQGETLWITIQYRVRTTNNLFNLVYPFYLAESFV
jgi:phage baseplate assembly protein W